MSKRLLGKPAADALDRETALRVNAVKERGITPTLAILRVGEREDDISYQCAAHRRAEALGIRVLSAVLPWDAAQEDVLGILQAWNEDHSVHGILLLRPLPAGLDEEALCQAIAPEKDMDGVTVASMAAVYAGTDSGFAPCTAEACIALLDHYGIDIEGKRAVVVGRSLVIGRPVAALLMGRNATVTLCHSRTAELSRRTGEAELVVAALGRAEYLRGEAFSAGQVVLDVGIHFSAEKQKLVGDVSFEEAEAIVRAITPVPGGVGSVTTAVLCRHVLRAAERG